MIINDMIINDISENKVIHSLETNKYAGYHYKINSATRIEPL